MKRFWTSPPGMADLVLWQPAAARGHGPHQAVVFGAVAATAGLGADAAALAAAHDTVAGPPRPPCACSGSTRSPYTTASPGSGPQITAVAADATRYAHTPRASLPARAAPALDVAAEQHATWEVRLFAS